MKTLVLLDVDCVLMPWDDESDEVLSSPTRSVYDRFGKKTGFKDWVYHDEPPRYLTFWSHDQHELIKQVGDVYWLTTWARDDLTDQYTEVTGFGPFPAARPGWNNRYESEYLYRWWKMGWLDVWIRENRELVSSYDRAIWVDDDHNREATMEGLAEVNFAFAGLGTELYIVQPQGPVWSRGEINQWLSET